MEISNAPQTGVCCAEQSMSAQTSVIKEEYACMESVPAWLDMRELIVHKNARVTDIKSNALRNVQRTLMELSLSSNVWNVLLDV